MQLNENISVIASFGLPYKLRPVRFRWNGRLMDIKEITYQWQTREGSQRLYHFAVTDGSSTYELSFNSALLVWNVEGVEDPS
jgi:hypothetical protein